MSGNNPVFTPLDFVDYEAKVRGMRREDLKIPPRLVMVYMQRNLRYLQRLTGSKCVKWWYNRQRPLHVGYYNHKPIALICNWVGAPAAAMIFEEVIALGAKEIIEFGVAGGIQPYLKPGDIFIVNSAKRDEGTSQHYFPRNMEVECSPELCDRIESYFSRQNKEFYKGAVWTTDGVYRETKSKFRKFRQAGVLGVNMETSALLAVAKYRNVRLSSIQVVSDILSESGWTFAPHAKEVRDSTRRTLKAAIEVLCAV